MKRSVIKDHKATYPDPIAFKAGDIVTLSGRTDIWDGHTWLWAQGPDGKVGWIPDSFLSSSDGTTRAVRQYQATELTCRKGDILLVIEEAHGWAWCKADNNQQGWVPLQNLSPIESGKVFPHLKPEEL
ncbi:SH3 domain-containing protein [Allorhizobium taibaishanense]|uniref:SH3 domain-containing protein n=2 Tax=Allorhizobium taibaishanense TaxID=887144 RepID=A0A1Q9AB47_9HYPH|nr:SH3 domain-containing protein [Allorhizobium taibaishanense]OLP52098.1 hypothetical protein BJF91_09590 [Allorhizobium taibaishanense]